MADDLQHHGLSVELGAELADKVRVFAAAARTDVEAVVRGAVARYVDDWSETMERLAQFDRDGISIGVEEAMEQFQTELTAALEARKTRRRR